MSSEQSQFLDPNYTPPPPPPITISELINSIQVVTKKEADDKALLEGISALSSDALREKLLIWALAGFPNVYEIHKVVITPPTRCSDGVSRELADYIVFCSGKTIQQHVSGLQDKVVGITVSFANMGTYISIVVSKL